MFSSRNFPAALAVFTAIAAAVFTSIILIRSSNNADSAFAFIGWAISPYIILIGISIFAGRRAESAWIALAGTLFVSIVGVYWLVDTFFIQPDPQAGLAVIVIPWLQWIGCGLAVAACLAVVFLKWLVWPERRTR